MATNALICSSSPLLVSKNSSSFSSSSQIGVGPQSLVFRCPTSTKTPSLVVKALAEEGGLSNVDPLVRKELRHIDPLLPMHLNKRVAMIDTSPYMRTPWNTTEDDNEIRMWFDVPGLAAPELDVNVVDNLLIIKGTEGIDAFGRKIHSPFDCKLQLPFNCAKDETQAVLKNGVLYISVPKITKAEHMKFIHVPVRAI
ncbi:small heat shock protein, chloroplastic-like [Silene latifolia]|uniref:small heat shock protein, chloroplastic-like n=1 Tax=Silene latifolia TaxID=37657 RepID=UPI003D779530